MSHAPARVAKNGSKTAKQGTFVTKWSLDNTPPSEDAIRVRNNQRRHRERVKTYITDLEAKVAALEADLTTANGTIERLTKENDQLRRTKEQQLQQPLPPQPLEHVISPETLRPLKAVTDALAAPEASDTSRPCCRPPTRDKAEAGDQEDLPAPKEGESTTSCETAYRMLQQQAAGKLDIETAEQFLRPGYRRSLQKGDGCRVQTHLVYGLLDRITS